MHCVDPASRLCVRVRTGRIWAVSSGEGPLSTERDELLNETLFSTLSDARQQIRAWQIDCNHNRRHSGLGNIAGCAPGGV
jgi:hypothetical protein